MFQRAQGCAHSPSVPNPFPSSILVLVRAPRKSNPCLYLRRAFLKPRRLSVVELYMPKSLVWWSAVYDEIVLKSFRSFSFMTYVPESPGSLGEYKKINLRFIITSLCFHKGHHSAFESCHPCSCMELFPQ